MKDDHQATTITYSEDGMYDEVECDCNDCSEGLGHQDSSAQPYIRDSAYLYELEMPHQPWITNWQKLDI